MDLLTNFVSIMAAGAMIFSGALQEAAPQHDISGTLFLVNREYMVSDAYEKSIIGDSTSDCHTGLCIGAGSIVSLVYGRPVRIDGHY